MFLQCHAVVGYRLSSINIINVLLSDSMARILSPNLNYVRGLYLVLYGILTPLTFDGFIPKL